MSRPGAQGADEAAWSIVITAQTTEARVVYVQPNGSGPDVISFPEFAEIVRRHNDPISQRFADSLCEWTRVKAGEKPADGRVQRS